eukprot:GFKZ01009571.1.p3 GENE.GFKZ01009571.1~~GFKZ01009571.1.p3  ORF type:complete len:124 (+),score=8.34 GFKZ01009571.1:886-1257(+)
MLSQSVPPPRTASPITLALMSLCSGLNLVTPSSSYDPNPNARPSNPTFSLPLSLSLPPALSLSLGWRPSLAFHFGAYKSAAGLTCSIPRSPAQVSSDFEEMEDLATTEPTNADDSASAMDHLS